jgi:hypothetical protein
MRSAITTYASALSRFISESMTTGSGSSAGRNTFDELALSAFAFQFDLVEPYRRFCLALGRTPTNVSCWSDIPAVPAIAFKELEMTSLPADRRSVVFHSSGTSRHTPSRHFHDRDSIRLYEASLLPWFQRHLLPDAPLTMNLLALTPPPAAAPHSSLAHMFETVRRFFAGRTAVYGGMIDVSGAWQLDADTCARTLRESVKLDQPLLILGTAFNFVHLIDFLESREIRLELPFGSRVMETGGYKGRSRILPREQLHERISESLGIARPWIVCEYGMSELSSQAYDHVAGHQQADPTQRTFRFPPWARARILSPETGSEVTVNQPGLIQIFDLANVRSVMAIQTEDVGVRRIDGFSLSGRAAHAAARGCSLQIG